LHYVEQRILSGLRAVEDGWNVLVELIREKIIDMVNHFNAFFEWLTPVDWKWGCK